MSGILATLYERVADLSSNPMALALLINRVESLLSGKVGGVIGIGIGGLTPAVVAALVAVALLVGGLLVWLRSEVALRVVEASDNFDDAASFALVQAIAAHAVVTAPTRSKLLGVHRWVPLEGGGDDLIELAYKRLILPGERISVADADGGSAIRIVYTTHKRTERDLASHTSSAPTPSRTVVDHRIELSSSGKDAMRRIDAFVERCIEESNRAVRSKAEADNAPSVWRPTARSDGKVVYTPYKILPGYALTPEICPCRDEMLARIEGMKKKMKNKNKTAVPAKTSIGVLLHGPPGTGKTTFVKALAEAAGNRHIVCVNLDMYRDSPEKLERLMYKGVFLKASKDDSSEDDDGTSWRIPVDRMVICFEECDRHADLLSRTCCPDVGPAGPDPKVNFRSNRELRAYNASRSNRLTLQQLLEILDGVVDVDGRIVIATTNAPEVLDHALKRAGRLGDFVIRLGELAADQVARALKQRFPGAAGSGLSGSELSGVTLAHLHQVLAGAASYGEAVDRLGHVGRAVKTALAAVETPRTPPLDDESDESDESDDSN
jgi:hypothetical protein